MISAIHRKWLSKCIEWRQPSAGILLSTYRLNRWGQYLSHGNLWYVKILPYLKIFEHAIDFSSLHYFKTPNWCEFISTVFRCTYFLNVMNKAENIYIILKNHEASPELLYGHSLSENASSYMTWSFHQATRLGWNLAGGSAIVLQTGYCRRWCNPHY